MPHLIRQIKVGADSDVRPPGRAPMKAKREPSDRKGSAYSSWLAGGGTLLPRAVSWAAEIDRKRPQNGNGPHRDEFLQQNPALAVHLAASTHAGSVPLYANAPCTPLGGQRGDATVRRCLAAKYSPMPNRRKLGWPTSQPSSI